MASCAACRAWVSELARTSWLEAAGGETTAAPPPGTGRYVPLVELGAGATGTVWAAYDAMLEREVALKVLDAEHDAIRRLRVEARALAALSHPNVVEVLDIQLADGPPAIAMELVEGPTLREWLAVAPRSVAAVLRVFTAAARGLAAAHDAGLVHRDFKPSNVLVGPGDRVRVADFGLAQVVLEPDPSTRWAGTPAYMAPEQRRGEPATPRSDQYAWCVALHEALTGHMPGANAETTSARAVAEAVPAHVQRCLARGLVDDPQARWPSMHALLRALTAAPPRRRWIGVAAVVGIATATTLAWAPAPACDDRGRSALAVTAASLVPTPAHRLFRIHVQRWEAADRDACLRAGSDDAPLAVAAQQRCLQRQAVHLRAAAQALVHADPLAAIHVAERLPVASDCLHAPPPLPAVDVALDAAVVASVVFADAGHNARAVAGFDALRDTVEQSAGPAVRTRFAYAYGSALWSAGRDATPWLERAAHEGASGADRRTAALAALQLAGNGSPAAPVDPDQASAWLERAQTLIEADALDDLQRGLSVARGHIAYDRGDFAAAITSLRAAVARARTDEDPPWVLADTLGSLATALRDAGDVGEAERAQTEALALVVDSRGEAHPSAALARAQLASIWVVAGRIDEAREAFSASLVQLEASLGPDHLDLAAVATNLASADLVAGEPERAVELLRRVTAIEAKVLTPGRATASTLHVLGNAYVLRDDLAAAQRAFATGLDHIERELGPEHPDRAIFLSSMASVALDQGDPERAIELATRSRGVRQAAFGADDPRLAFEDLVLAGAYLDAGRPTQALDVARRGRGLLEAAPVRPRWLAELHYFEARALAALGNKESALDAARKGAEGFEAASDPAVAAEIRAWAAAL